MFYSDEVVYDVTRPYFVGSAADLLLGKWPNCSVVIKTAAFHIVHGLSRHTEYRLFNVSVSNSAESAWVATCDGAINISLSELLQVIVRTSCLFHLARWPALFEVRTFHIDCVTCRPTCTTAYTCWNTSSSAVDRQSSTADYEVQ